jgi:hypothetical protein
MEPIRQLPVSASIRCGLQVIFTKEPSERALPLPATLRRHSARSAAARRNRCQRLDWLLIKCFRAPGGAVEAFGPTIALKHPDDAVCSDMSQRSDRRPTSTYGRVWVVSPVWIRAWGRRALSYASTSSNQSPIARFVAEKQGHPVCPPAFCASDWRRGHRRPACNMHQRQGEKATPAEEEVFDGRKRGLEERHGPSAGEMDQRPRARIRPTPKRPAVDCLPEPILPTIVGRSS